MQHLFTAIVCDPAEFNGTGHQQIETGGLIALAKQRFTLFELAADSDSASSARSGSFIPENSRDFFSSSISSIQNPVKTHHEELHINPHQQVLCML
jgi:hypothetical protein